MKGFLSRALATVALTLCALPIAAQTTPTYSDETVISFLGKTTSGVGPGSDLTSEYLMSLLDENGKKYVESIEWNSIRTFPDVPSAPSKIGLQIEYLNNIAGYITLNFKKAATFNAGRIYLFGGLSNNAPGKTTLQAYANFGENDQQVLALGNVGNPIYFDQKFKTVRSLENLIEEMKKSSSSIYVNSYFRIIRTPEAEKQFPLRSLTLKVEPTSNMGIALHGIKILHNGFVENDINTGVEEIAQENGAVEYFDLYGRRLADKPTQGLFIEKRGSKVTKLLAR